MGVFSTSVSLIESIWIIMNGVAMVQYATLSAMGDAATAAKVTAKWAVNSFILTLMALVILNLLPAGLFSWLFGKGFEEVKTFFPFLSPGIAISGLTGIYAHYFAARGDMRTPALSAFFGLIVTVTLAFILIPVFGAEGAAWTNTFSYLVSGIFLLIMFKIKSGYSFLEVFNIRRVRGETANL